MQPSVILFINVASRLRFKKTFLAVLPLLPFAFAYSFKTLYTALHNCSVETEMSSKWVYVPLPYHIPCNLKIIMPTFQ